VTRQAPTTPAARRARIGELLRGTPVRSQTQLVGLLAGEGVLVTQATLSRDLEELGAVKARGVYAAPEPEDAVRSLRPAPTPAPLARLTRLCAELLLSAEASPPTVVLRTPPGAAQLLASALDLSALPEVAGCVAGDDTVLVVTRPAPEGAGPGAPAEALAARLVALALDAPTDPAPTDPAPTDPAPTDPAPTDPAPTDPAPTPTTPRETPRP